MAEGEAEGEDRTEAPTPRRLEKAREEGRVALSRELVAFATLAFGTLGLMVALPPLGARMLAAMRGVLDQAHRLEAGRVAQDLALAGLLVVLGVGGLVAIAAIGAVLLQTRGLVSARGLMPDFGRLSPMAGIKRLLGVDAVIEFARNLLKIGIIGTALWSVAARPERLLRLVEASPGLLLREIASLSFALMGAALAAFGLIAALDLLVVHLRHRHGLRMSRDDLRQEMKDSEGDPHVRMKRRQIRESRARRRMLADVPKAAVVITNPTHYAVALAYERGSDAAPTVVARGVDSLAARIREVAAQNGVPLVANPPLARALYPLEPGTEIPPQHYQAVAEIIAYVLRLGRSGKNQGIENRA